MITAISTRDYEARQIADVTEAFSRHTITTRSEGRWLLHERAADGGRRHNMWAEVIVLAGGKLLVHGDVETVIFAYYHDSRDPRDVLRWMARSDIGYVASKALLGSGSNDTKTIDDGVLLYDLQQALVDRREDAGDGDEDVVEAIEEAIRNVHRYESGQEIRRALYEADTEAGGDGEWTSSLGRVTDRRVFAARALIRRLCDLLDAEAAATEARHG